MSDLEEDKNFLEEFHSLHNEFIRIIRTDYEKYYSPFVAPIAKRNEIMDVLYNIGHVVLGYWDDVVELPKEELVYVLNFIKLGKGMQITSCWAVTLTEDFQNLYENYTNSR